MRIKEFFNKKINVAWVTAVLILIAILTICVATSHSKYVLEKELTFSLGIIESDEWNKRTLITGEELNKVLKETGSTQVVFGYEDDFSSEIEGAKGVAVGIADGAKSFKEDDIKLYTVTDTENNITTAYILSEYQIKANANSSKMFYENENQAQTLTNIFFLNFETSIVENMESMFEGCKNLTELDLSKFDTAKVTNISRMFYECNLLETIYVSELWDISGIETTQDNVFYNCVKLKGGNSTTYNEENPIITSDYACIDTASEGETPAKPGYFTYKGIDTEEQITFNLVRRNVTEKTDKENTTTTTNTSTSTNSNINTDSNNEKTTSSNTTTNNDDTKKETENKDKTETDTNTDTDTESDNTDSNDDTSLNDNTDSNDSSNTTEELEDDKKDIEPVEDEEKIEDEEENTEENVEDNGTENTSVE